MSIKVKLLAGCLLLTAITVGLGAFTQASQRTIGSLGARIFDQTFLAMSYLRASQNGLTRLSAAAHLVEAREGTAANEARAAAVAGLLAQALPEILDDLQVAHDRAASPEGRLVTEAIRAHLAALAAAPGTASAVQVAALDSAQAEFDRAVEVYAGDGFRDRRMMGRLVDQSLEQTWAAIVASALLAAAISLLLGRAIVRPVRNAVAVAEAVSAGRLDTPIEARGRDETALLLRALARMQASIRESLERIRLLADEASGHAEALRVQNGRFGAALDNMSQGLCLFDASGRLAVSNQRFAAMFGAPELGACPEAVVAVSGVPAAGIGGPRFQHTLPDGRVIAVSHQPVEGGGWVDTYEDVTERTRAENRLAHMARHDALTGLPNRVLFRENLDHLLSGGRPDGPPTVLCLDLDGFKAVNDTLGHPVGDELLRQVGARVLACVESGDVVARLGGDEFAVIQTGAADRARAEALAERLVGVLGTPFEVERHTVGIGVSIGIAAGGEGAGPERATTLLRNADLALYHAKAEGRGTHRFFAPEMDERLRARRGLELDLRSALERDEFELFFQPLFNTERGEVSGFEALLRWRHPERGMVSPAEFIPLAEETGLIKGIGAWVLRRACLEAARWPDGIRVAVNLSPVQFRSPLLAAEVVRALAASGLAPGRLELEITESVLLQDDASVLATLHQIRQLGVGVSLDDFGTGYSSLSYLRRFPFDKIKIDQSFVRQIGEADNIAIVRAVLSLGQALNIAVVAEGVETQEQLSILEGEGCSEVQGYLFSPPRPGPQVGDLIQRLARPARPVLLVANG